MWFGCLNRNVYGSSCNHHCLINVVYIKLCSALPISLIASFLMKLKVFLQFCLKIIYLRHENVSFNLMSGFKTTRLQSRTASFCYFKYMLAQYFHIVVSLLAQFCLNLHIISIILTPYRWQHPVDTFVSAITETYSTVKNTNSTGAT